MSVLAYLTRTLERDTQNARLRITLAAWLCLIGHPLYWAIWVYLIPQPHESAALRFGSAALALGLIFRNRWPAQTKKYLPLYWHFFMLIMLPVLFTFLALKNNFNLVWTLCHFGMIFLMILLILEIIWFWIILVMGTLIGTFLFWLDGGVLSSISISIKYIPIMLFALLFCTVFMRLAMLDILRAEGKAAAEAHRAEVFKALSGSIAHEVRNPVSSAQQAVVFIQKGLEDLKALKAAGDDAQFEKKRATLARITASAYEGLKRGDIVIQMILKNIREEGIDPAGFREFSAAEAVAKALEAYPFQRREAEYVVHGLERDFTIRGDENLLIFALFNLLKNALYYLPSCPESRITIALQPGEADNRLLFKDTGPGIAEHVLPHIFESFATYEKAGGTGLGLPFCKRVMAAMNGDITCTSQAGAGAEFILSFPKAKSDV